jgi:hypothetical protein
MPEHVRSKRLLEVADKETRLTEFEVQHLEKCSDCLAVYAESILEVVWQRARKKRKSQSTSSL